MNLKNYKIKITLFISFVIFILFFLSWIAFFVYTNYSNLSRKKHILNKAYYKIIHSSNTKIEDLIKNINLLSLMRVVSSMLSDKNQTNIKIKRLIWVPYVYISESDSIIFKNFDPQDCKKDFICKSLKKWKYYFVVAIQNNNENLVTNIFLFWIFSFVVTILFFPIVRYIVWKLTKPLEENLEFMKNFVNNTWHELKTPLANINLWSQILLNKKSYNEEIIQNIENESKKLWLIIDTLLELSSISKFQKKEYVSLKQIIDEVIWKYNDILKEFDIDLKIENTNIKTNKYHFFILFENILKNAIKYNNYKKRIKIVLTKNYLIMYNTTDNIPNNFKKIFNLFYKENFSSDWYWLWLAIVRRIAQVNNWKIKSASTKNCFGIKIEF